MTHHSSIVVESQFDLKNLELPLFFFFGNLNNRSSKIILITSMCSKSSSQPKLNPNPYSKVTRKWDPNPPSQLGPILHPQNIIITSLTHRHFKNGGIEGNFELRSLAGGPLLNFTKHLNLHSNFCVYFLFLKS